MNNEQKTCSEMKSSTTEKQRSISINIVAGYTSILKRLVVELLWLNRWFQYQYISRAPHKKEKKTFSPALSSSVSLFSMYCYYTKSYLPIYRHVGAYAQGAKHPKPTLTKTLESESFRLQWIWAQERKSLNWHSEKKQITQMKFKITFFRFKFNIVPFRLCIWLGFFSFRFIMLMALILYLSISMFVSVFV